MDFSITYGNNPSQDFTVVKESFTFDRLPLLVVYGAPKKAVVLYVGTLVEFGQVGHELAAER